MGTRWIAPLRIAVALSLTFGAGASAQPRTPRRGAARTATPWQVPAGGDASGNYVRVELVEREGELHGTRRVERIDAPSGYTTGTNATIVLAGREPETRRSLRVHLPYGATLDLAVGDTVQVDATSRLMGLGTAQEVVLKRRGQIVLLATGAQRKAGFRVWRGAEVPRRGSRRQWGLRVSFAGSHIETTPGQVLYVTPASLLVSGTEIAYEGVRPPDAFDQRVLTVVRIRPPAAPAR